MIFIKLDKHKLKNKRNECISFLSVVFLLQALPYCVVMNLMNVFAGSDWIVWLGGNAVMLNLTFTMRAVAVAICSPMIASILNNRLGHEFKHKISL